MIWFNCSSFTGAFGPRQSLIITPATMSSTQGTDSNQWKLHISSLLKPRLNLNTSTLSHKHTLQLQVLIPICALVNKAANVKVLYHLCKSAKQNACLKLSCTQLIQTLFYHHVHTGNALRWQQLVHKHKLNSYLFTSCDIMSRTLYITYNCGSSLLVACAIRNECVKNYNK